MSRHVAAVSAGKRRSIFVRTKRPVGVLRFLRLVAVVASLAVAMALAGARDAAAVTDITSKGSIAFARDHNIWLTSPDGETQQPLTTDGTLTAPYHSPTQSDDGAVVVAVQDRGGPGSVVSLLYVMNRAGELLSVPFAPTQYPIVPANYCAGLNQYPTGIVAAVSPDGTKIAVNELGVFFQPGFCDGTTQSQIYVINADGSTINGETLIQPPAQGTSPLSETAPSWVGNTRLLMHHDLPYGIDYYDVGADRAAKWLTASGAPDDGAYRFPALVANKLAASGFGSNVRDVVRLSTMNAAIPTAPTPRCEISDPAHPSYDPSFDMTAPTIAPDGAAVAWIETHFANGVAQSTDIYISPIGDISAGNCDSLHREILIPNGSDPDWGPAALGPPSPFATLPVCPANHPGTPPSCGQPAASCPAGQTGTPPDCVAPSQPQNPPPEASASPGQPPPPPPTTAPKPKSPPARIVRIIKLRSGCSRKQLTISGRGVTVTAAKQLPRSRCKLTLTVAPSAKGRRDLLIKHGKRKTRIRAIIHL